MADMPMADRSASVTREATLPGRGRPGFDERAKAVVDEELDAESVQIWIDSELKNYGADARLLVARAFRACLAARRQREPQRESLHALQEELFFHHPKDAS